MLAKLTLRSLRAQPLRLALSSLATVLGVAFIAGTLMLTEGMRSASYARAGVFDRGTDVAVYPADDTATGATGAQKPGLTSALLDKVRGVAGVRAAEGEANGSGRVLGGNGRPVPGYAVLVSVPADPDLQSYDLSRGRLPQRPGEVVLDTRTVERQRFAVGSTVRIGGTTGKVGDYQLVGAVDVAGTPRDLGGAFIGMTGPDALAVTEQTGYARILVAAAPGQSDAALATRVAAAVGTGPVVKTHQQILDDGLKAAVQDIGQFNMMLLLFALISVLVAAFVIANTFIIVLAQRTRQIALLRLIGATRGQAFRLVLLEAAVTGLVASVVGLALGAGVAVGMRAMLARIGSPPDGDIALTPSIGLISVCLGVLITAGAAVLPAWRGAQVAPVAVLSDAAVLTARRTGRVRLVVGAVSLAIGAAALLGAGVAGNIALVGLGGVGTFTGIAMFGPVLVPTLVWVLGWPACRLLGATAGLAVSNAVRNPRRIAATATALVIGIGLVSAFVIGAQSVKAGIERGVDKQIGADYVVVAVGSTLPPALVGELGRRTELGVLHEPREIVSGAALVISAHPALVVRSLTRIVDGDVSRFGAGTALVYQPLAQRLGLRAGSDVEVADRRFPVAAVVEGDLGPVDPSSGVPAGHTIVLSDADFSAAFPTTRGRLLAIEAAPGLSDQRVRDAIEAVLTNYPTVTLMDQTAYKKMLTGTVDMVLAFVTALLGLTVVIALVGVANTLTLSVVERTRENGVLRAVGLTRGRMRGMLAVEAVLTVLVGAVLGIALGTGVSAGAVGFLNNLGGDFALDLPWSQLALILGAAVLTALAASVLPARRAAGRAVVEALGTE